MKISAKREYDPIILEPPSTSSRRGPSKTLFDRLDSWRALNVIAEPRGPPTAVRHRYPAPLDMCSLPARHVLPLARHVLSPHQTRHGLGEAGLPVAWPSAKAGSSGNRIVRPLYGADPCPGGLIFVSTAPINDSSKKPLRIPALDSSRRSGTTPSAAPASCRLGMTVPPILYTGRPDGGEEALNASCGSPLDRRRRSASAAKVLTPLPIVKGSGESEPSLDGAGVMPREMVLGR